MNIIVVPLKVNEFTEGIIIRSKMLRKLFIIWEFWFR